MDYKALKKLLKPLKGAKGKAWLKKGGAGGGGEASDSGQCALMCGRVDVCGKITREWVVGGVPV